MAESWYIGRGIVFLAWLAQPRSASKFVDPKSVVFAAPDSSAKGIEITLGFSNVTALFKHAEFLGCPPSSEELARQASSLSQTSSTMSDLISDIDMINEAVHICKEKNEALIDELMKAESPGEMPAGSEAGRVKTIQEMAPVGVDAKVGPLIELPAICVSLHRIAASTLILVDEQLKYKAGGLEVADTVNLQVARL